jgi:hypothetical protein
MAAELNRTKQSKLGGERKEGAGRQEGQRKRAAKLLRLSSRKRQVRRNTLR